MKPVLNPYAQMLAAWKPEYFYGRRAEILLILQSISSCNILPGSFSLFGAKTFGKSSLLHYLIHPDGAAHRPEYKAAFVDLQPQHTPGLVFVLIDCNDVDGPQALPSLYDGLLENEQVRRLAEQQKLPGTVETPGEARQALRVLLPQAAKSGLRLVICIDHFDRAFAALDPGDEYFLRNQFTGHALLIATERSLPELRQASNRSSSPLLNLLLPVPVGLMAREEAVDLVEQPAVQAGAPFSPAETAFLLEMAGRHPYLLTLAARMLFDLRGQYLIDPGGFGPDGSARRQIQQQLLALPAVDELLAFYWRQLEPIEQRALQATAAGSGPLADDLSPGLTHLIGSSLVYPDLERGGYRPFGELFAAYVARQAPPPPPERLDAPPEGLSQRDQKLLQYLRDRAGQVCSSGELLQEIWGDPGASNRGLEASIHRLRRKLAEEYGPDWNYIRNERGVGYRFLPRP